MCLPICARSITPNPSCLKIPFPRTRYSTWAALFASYHYLVSDKHGGAIENGYRGKRKYTDFLGLDPVHQPFPI